MFTLGLLYDHGLPNETPLAARLARHTRLRALTYEHLHQLPRWWWRGAQFGAARPPVLPLVPRLRWRGGLQRPFFARFMRDCAAVIFTRIDQSPLLSAVPRARRVALLSDDDTLFGRPPALEAALVARCELVITVSEGLAADIIRRTAAAREKFFIAPNAIDDDAVPPTPPPPAADRTGRPTDQPLAGVLGALSGGRYRLDWIEDLVTRLPWLHWLFAGRIEWWNLSPAEAAAVRRLQAHPRCHFPAVDPRSGNPQRDFAARVDVALVPYTAGPLIASASPARAYFHFAHGTPVLAPSSCPQLAAHAPLVTVCDSPVEFAAALTRLRATNFDDGLRRDRWLAASAHTVDQRARAIVARIGAVLAATPAPPRPACPCP
jgi:hypothetical protein